MELNAKTSRIFCGRDAWKVKEENNWQLLVTQWYSTSCKINMLDRCFSQSEIIHDCTIPLRVFHWVLAVQSVLLLEDRGVWRLLRTYISPGCLKSFHTLWNSVGCRTPARHLGEIVWQEERCERVTTDTTDRFDTWDHIWHHLFRVLIWDNFSLLIKDGEHYDCGYYLCKSERGIPLHRSPRSTFILIYLRRLMTI